MTEKGKKAGPRGMTAMTVFLCVGTLAAAAAGVTLVWRGTFLDRIWMLNPRAYAELTPLGRAPGVGFLFLGGFLGLTAWGWSRRRVWGWWMAVTVIAAQVLGGVFHIFTAHIAQGVVGISISGLLLLYLLLPGVRAAFKTVSWAQQKGV